MGARITQEILVLLHQKPTLWSAWGVGEEAPEEKCVGMKWQLTHLCLCVSPWLAWFPVELPAFCRQPAFLHASLQPSLRYRSINYLLEPSHPLQSPFHFPSDQRSAKSVCGCSPWETHSKSHFLDLSLFPASVEIHLQIPTLDFCVSFPPSSLSQRFPSAKTTSAVSCPSGSSL